MSSIKSHWESLSKLTMGGNVIFLPAVAFISPSLQGSLDDYKSN